MKYWLLKSEPGAFSILDLERKRKESWDGVRNYQARNSLRDEMSPGDLGIFYHSNALPSGAAGVCRIASPSRPDPTAFEPGHIHFDPKSDPESPRWWLVDVEFVQKFRQVIPLSILRDIPALANMSLLRKGQRLSVMQITKGEFEAIIQLSN
jgi:predicted RNA-binding protein with PUA-like domain